MSNAESIKNLTDLIQRFEIPVAVGDPTRDFVYTVGYIDAVIEYRNKITDEEAKQMVEMILKHIKVGK